MISDKRPMMSYVLFLFLICTVAQSGKNDCLNGGWLDVNACVRDESKCSCKCPAGFEGKLCERSYCVHGILNDTVVVSNSDQMNCTCYNGWSGVRCDSVSCIHGVKFNKSHCVQCDNWYEGDACMDIKCSHGKKGKGYDSDKCICDSAVWTGKWCNRESCGRGRLSENHNDSTNDTCRCELGWYGVICDQQHWWMVFLDNIGFIIIGVFVSAFFCSCGCFFYKYPTSFCKRERPTATEIPTQITYHSTSQPERTYTSVSQYAEPSAPLPSTTPSAPHADFTEQPPPNYEQALLYSKP